MNVQLAQKLVANVQRLAEQEMRQLSKPQQKNVLMLAKLALKNAKNTLIWRVAKTALSLVVNAQNFAEA